jgi:hypothetical protein
MSRQPILKQAVEWAASRFTMSVWGWGQGGQGGQGGGGGGAGGGQGGQEGAVGDKNNSREAIMRLDPQCT